MKKVLALVLALVMVLGTFGTAFAAYDDVAGTATESAVDRLSLLGILEGYPDGTFRPEGQITRAEFAAVAVRAKGLENVAKAAQGLSTGFTDVAATSWASGYVGTAQRLSIVNGVGNGLFAPNAPVKYEEAVTMIVRALGYEAAAQAKGGYPYGYLIVANEVGLLDAVKGTQGVPATRGLVAQLTDNALETAMMIQVGFGTDTKWVVSGTEGTKEVNLLDNMGFDVYEDVLEVVSTSRGTIKLEGKTLNVGKDFDFEFFEALTVKAWADGSDVVVYAAQNEALYDATTVNKAKVKLVDADVSYDLVKGLEAKEADLAKVVLNDDDEVEFIKYYNFDVIVVEEVEDELVFGLGGEELDLTDYNLTLEGKQISIDSLEEGDILFFDTTEEYAEVFNKTVEGELSTVYDEEFRLNGKIYTIAGGQYLDGSSLKALDSDALEAMKEEGEVTVFFDRAGNVVFVAGDLGTVATSSFYALVVEDTASFTVRNRTMYTLELVNQEGKVVSYDITKTFADEYTAEKQANNWTADIKAGEVIKVTVDEDGDITKIEALRNPAVMGSKFDVTERYVGNYRLADSAVVFYTEETSYVAAEGATPAKYSKPKDIEVMTWKEAKTKFSEVEVGNAYANSATNVVALEISETNADTEDDKYTGLVTKVRKTTASTATWEITLKVAGEEMVLLTDGDITVNTNNIKKGVFVDIEVGKNSGKIKSIVTAAKQTAVLTIEEVNVAKNTILAGTTFELTSDAVIYENNSSLSTLRLRDLKVGDKVIVVKDGASARFVNYVLRTAKAGDVVTSPEVESTTYIVKSYTAAFGRLTLEDVNAKESYKTVDSFDAVYFNDVEVTKSFMKTWFVGKTNVVIEVTEDNELVVDATPTELTWNIVKQDFSVVNAGALLTGTGVDYSSVESLEVKWFDADGKLLLTGELNVEELIDQYAPGTQVSMPYNSSFDYEADGIWTVDGDFGGEPAKDPAKVLFTVIFNTGVKATAENTL